MTTPEPAPTTAEESSVVAPPPAAEPVVPAVPGGDGDAGTQGGASLTPHIPNVGGIEFDADTDENDSAYAESDLGSYTTSLKSSVLNYKFENGRRYHGFKDDSYVFPNDEQEMDRLDMQHHLMTMIKGDKLHLAPLDNPQKVLDIGTVS
jgi:hypothetical protein